LNEAGANLERLPCGTKCLRVAILTVAIFAVFSVIRKKRLPAKIFSEKINSAGKIIHAIMT